MFENCEKKVFFCLAGFKLSKMFSDFKLSQKNTVKVSTFQNCILEKLDFIKLFKVFRFLDLKILYNSFASSFSVKI